MTQYKTSYLTVRSILLSQIYSDSSLKEIASLLASVLSICVKHSVMLTEIVKTAEKKKRKKSIYLHLDTFLYCCFLYISLKKIKSFELWFQNNQR